MTSNWASKWPLLKMEARAGNMNVPSVVFDPQCLSCSCRALMLQLSNDRGMRLLSVLDAVFQLVKGCSEGRLIVPEQRFQILSSFVQVWMQCQGFLKENWILGFSGLTGPFATKIFLRYGFLLKGECVIRYSLEIMASVGASFPFLLVIAIQRLLGNYSAAGKIHTVALQHLWRWPNAL